MESVTAESLMNLELGIVNPNLLDITSDLFLPQKAGQTRLSFLSQTNSKQIGNNSFDNYSRHTVNHLRPYDHRMTWDPRFTSDARLALEAKLNYEHRMLANHYMQAEEKILFNSIENRHGHHILPNTTQCYADAENGVDNILPIIERTNKKGRKPSRKMLANSPYNNPGIEKSRQKYRRRPSPLVTDEDYYFEYMAPSDPSVMEKMPKLYQELSRYNHSEKDDGRVSVKVKPGNLYQTEYVMGSGMDKFGLCPLCPQENWFKLKISAYWYHMNYFHGVGRDGQQLSKPLIFRKCIARNPDSCKVKKDMIQGQCKYCQQWVSIYGARHNKLKYPEILWWKHIRGCTMGSANRSYTSSTDSTLTTIDQSL